jgi:hypothetical protein
VNLRSADAERPGDGAGGPKASGLLMVDGTLVMLVRNTGNSQLAWSKDRGRTWTWGAKWQTSFGCPAFLNFGRHYAGARDDYVYVYSPDGPSAYESADQLVLARAPKARFTDVDAYEYFVRLDEAGHPVWSRDIAQRGGVLRKPGECQRVDAVYNPGLKRYLLTMGFSHRGDWGLYDAPEPWGPWTKVWEGGAGWDLLGTHGYRLPAKWISDDGRTLGLVFSGVQENDAFCVRPMTIE